MEDVKDVYKDIYFNTVSAHRIGEARHTYLREHNVSTRNLVAVVGHASCETPLNIMAFGCAVVYAPDYVDDVIIRHAEEMK